MTEPAFVYETDIATTPQRLWEALTSGELTRRYWFDRRVESDWAVGSPVRFYDGGSDVITDTGVVVEADPPKRLVYTFHQVEEGEDALAGPPEGASTRVAFDLEPLDDGRVRFRLVHDQLDSPEDIEGWSAGWAPILTNLQALLEGHNPR